MPRTRSLPGHPAEALAAELAVLGLSSGDHLMALYRDWLDQHGLQTSATLEQCDDGQRVKLAGLCIVHQAPPTAKGFHFLCLEDEWGMTNVIVSPGCDSNQKAAISARLWFQ
jgi:error-prone DNA polymerase